MAGPKAAGLWGGHDETIDRLAKEGHPLPLARRVVPGQVRFEALALALGPGDDHVAAEEAVCRGWSWVACQAGSALWVAK